jgi:hypothetical protein
MTENKDPEDKNDVDKMEDAVNALRKDRVEDLANTASLLGSWMSDQKLTVAEQLATVELLRSSILANYIQMKQMVGMAQFIEDNPNAKIVVVDATKKAQPPIQPDTFDPARS